MGWYELARGVARGLLIVNTLLFTDVIFDSDESWGAFQVVHGVAHQTVHDALLRLNLVPFFVPLYDFPREGNAEYLLDHYQTHLSNASLLGIVGVPDLSSYDLDSEGQFIDFLALHAQVHAAENQALGIV